MVYGFIIWLLYEKVNSKIRLFRDKRVTDALIQFVVEHNVINVFELMQHDFRFRHGLRDRQHEYVEIHAVQKAFCFCHFAPAALIKRDAAATDVGFFFGFG